MSLPCSELRRSRRCAWRSGTVANIKSSEWARTDTASQTTFVPSTGLHVLLHSSHLSPSLTFSLHLLTYFAEACVQTKHFLIFPCLSPAWHPRICLWSQHNAWCCSKCTHSGGSAWEVQPVHTDICEAFIIVRRELCKYNDCFSFVWSYSCARTNATLAFRVLKFAFMQ